MTVKIKQIGLPTGTAGQVWVLDGSGGVNAADQTGSGSGTVSDAVLVTQDIPAVTAPTLVTVGATTPALSHPDGSTTGQRFEHPVSKAYLSGDLTLNAVYKMSTAVASPNNVIRIETTAEIAKASTGAIDSATYPATEADLTVPDNTTNTVRQAVKTISAGDFGAGDVIQFYAKRVGAHANDVHTGAWELIGYDVSYTAQVIAQVSSQFIGQNVFTDTDETPAAVGTKGNFDTLDFITGVDREQKAAFQIPDNWDGVSDITVQAFYAMASSESAKVVRMATEGEIANTTTGAIDTLAAINVDVAVPGNTNLVRSPVLRTILASAVVSGDYVTLKFARRGSATEDTHGGSLQLLGLLVYAPSSTSQAPTSNTAVQKLATITAVDAKTVAESNLYTVPTGKTLRHYYAVVRCATATAITVGAECGVGVAAGADDMIGQQLLLGLDAAGKVRSIGMGGTGVEATAGQVVKFGVDVVATGTAQTLDVDLVGYLV